ncbi:hypothetical protein [Trichloromonas sp.]|uniref:hypothetical protein n=1 Tax=Trichloromonas sp. TaxID=3069249 RepID=UPI002A4556CA|nr:hypothetical protein [Trichloromonas sp.]
MDDNLSRLEELCLKAQAHPVAKTKVTSPIEGLLSTVSVLAWLKTRHEEGDPLAALEAIDVSWQRGFSLPIWAHGALARRSAKFLMDGQASIDEAFDAPTQARERRLRVSRIVDAMHHMDFLCYTMGLPARIAAVIVSALPVTAHTVAGFNRQDVSDVKQPLKPGTIAQEWKLYTLKERIPEHLTDPMQDLTTLMDEYEPTIFRLLEDGTFRRPDREKIIKAHARLVGKTLPHFPTL